MIPSACCCGWDWGCSGCCAGCIAAGWGWGDPSTEATAEVGLIESGNRFVLRRNCLEEFVMPAVVEVVGSMFILSVFTFELAVVPTLLLLFFSSDIFKYSAVLSSRQWKKISKTQ